MTRPAVPAGGSAGSPGRSASGRSVGRGRGVTGPATGSLTYDPLDRLSVLTGTQGATYAYAGSAEIAALANTGGSLNNRFVRGPRPDELLVSYAGTSGALNPVYWINDPQNSPVAQPDGTASQVWTYDEYGQRGPTNGLRTQYTGQLWLPDFGVYHYKARAYHPGLGRFMQTDPIGYEDGMNLYAYVANDPVNRTDPTGTEECGWFCRTVEGVGARLGVVGMRSEAVRNQYDDRLRNLDPNDSAGRSAAKADARAQTPPEVRTQVERARPGTGPRAGSGGTANRTNAGANAAARNLGRVGRASVAVTVVTAGADIALADDPNRAAVANAFAIGGGILGGAGGASLGALTGPAAPVASPALGIAGSAAGGEVGYRAGERIYDWFETTF